MNMFNRKTLHGLATLLGTKLKFQLANVEFILANLEFKLVNLKF